MATINEMKQVANQIKNATVQGENTASKVGGLLSDIVDHLDDGGGSGGGGTVTSVGVSVSGGLSVAGSPITKSGTIQLGIDGSHHLPTNDEVSAWNAGGGSGSQGYQKVFFANADKSASISAPSKDSYVYGDGTNDYFNTTPRWTRTNTNPGENEYTYGIWVYFNSANEIITIDGPVLLTGGGSGSNGEDGEEIEWVYMRRASELSPSDSTIIQNQLEACKGDAQAQGGKTFRDEDAVPTDWVDNAQGVDDGDHKYEYAAFRRSKNGANGKRTWGDDYFHGPLLWSAYGKQGMDGDGVEYIFYADKNGTIEPGNDPREWTNDEHFQDQEYIRDHTKWKDDPIDLSEEGFGPGSVEWVSMRKKQTVIKNGVEVHEWQAYSEPAVWSRLGKDGVVDGYTVDLVNENMIVNTDEDGKVTGYTNRGWVHVYHNSNPIPYADQASSTEYTYTIGTPIDASGNTVSGVSASKNSTDKTQVDVSIPTFNNFKSKSVFIPITVTLPNNTNRSLEFTLYGVVGGEFIDMYVGTKAIRCNNNGSDPQPSTVEIGVTLGKTTYKSVYNGGEGSAESLGYTFKYSNDGESAISISGPVTVYANHSTLEVFMYKDGHFVDSESIPYIKDGGDGRGIQSVVAHYRAVAAKQAPSDIGLSDPIDPANLNPAWGTDYPYLYARDYTTYTNGDTPTWGEPYFVNEWQGGGGGEEPGWVVTTLNDNAVIDDQTTGAVALESATLNTLKVYKGISEETRSCAYQVGALSLPESNTLQLKAWDGGGQYIPLTRVGNNTTYNNFLLVPNPNATATSHTPGNYYYDIVVMYKGSEVGRKRFKLYIDANISADGSFYKLSIENDTISYDGDGNIQSTVSPIIKAYKISNTGTSTQENITPVQSISQITPSENKLYVELGSLYVNASAQTEQSSITLSNGTISYAANGYDVTLYKGSNYVDGPEHIDCIKDGKNGSGEATTIYDLIPNPATIRFTYNSEGMPVTPSFNLDVTGKQITGATSSDFVFDANEGYVSPDGNYKIFTSRTQLDGSTTAPSTVQSLPITVNESDNTCAINFYIAKSIQAPTLVGVCKEISVPVIRDGKKGESGGGSTGTVGKFFYYGGEWDYNPKVDVTDYQAPYVKATVNGVTDFYMYTGDTTPTQGPDTDTKWVKIEYQEYLMSDAMFANYAHIGGLIINRDWEISQYGSINGASTDPTIAYTSFDPIAFMTKLKGSASIGVITRSSGTNSQIFKIIGSVTITVKGSGSSTTLIKFKDDSYFRFDNSPALDASTYYVGQSVTKSLTNGQATFLISNGAYCFVDGSLYDIQAVASSADTASVWYPHYAVDLRSGSTYQNDAYVRGEIHADSGNIGGVTIDQDGNLNLLGSLYVKDGDTVKLKIDSDTTSTSSSEKQSILDKAGLYIKQSDSDGIRISAANGVQRYDPVSNSWIGLYAKRKVRILNQREETLNSSDDLVLCSSSTTRIYLPSGSNGDTLSIRVLYGAGPNLRLSNKSQRLYTDTSHPDEELTNYYLGQNHMCDFVFYQNTWYMNSYGLAG